MKENKVAKTFKALWAIVKNPWLLNHVLADDKLWLDYVTKNHNINSFPVIEITTLFPAFKEELSTFAFLEGGSLPIDLALIRGLCKTIPDCKYFEIGTCRGESVINVADVCSQCYTLDLEPGQLVDATESKLIGFFSKNSPKITQLYGDSRTFNYADLNQKFDVIFIDGDHHYESVKSDTENMFKQLTHGNTIVIWHDYGFDPVTVRHEVMAAILDGTPVSLRNNLYHISNTMCAIYLNKKLPTTGLDSAHIPNKKFSVKIESNPL